MSEKETETVVLDEALIKEIVSDGKERPEGESRLVKVSTPSETAGADEPDADDR